MFNLSQTRLSYSSTPAGVVGTISNHPLELYTNGNAKATISTSGNLGLGVTPSAWSSPFKVLEGGGSGFQQFIGFQNNDNSLKLGVNQYYNGSNYVYTNNGLASRLDINADKFIWNTAPSGTAGNAITFTQAMTLTANGRLLLGTTTEGTYLLDVNGSGRFSETSWITKNQNGVTSINLVNNDLNNDAGQALRFYFNTSTPLGGIIHQYNTGTSAYDLDFKVWSGFSPVTRLFLNGSTGAATFSSSVTATQFTSQGGRGTSYGYKLPDWQIYNTTSGNRLAFSDYTTDFLTITSGGNLLVGTTTDSGEKLQISGSLKASTGSFTSGAKSLQIGNATDGVDNYLRLVGQSQNWDIVARNTAANSTFSIAESGVGFVLQIATGGAATFTSSVQTGTPTGGTARPWKLGQYNATAPTATGYVEVEINGVLYKLIAAT
jgi:hypothetical protein